MSNKILSFVVFITFFVFELTTLADYGINWDAITHLSRGQAFLHFYLTGKTDYLDLPNWSLYKDKRLYFQDPNTIFFSPDIPKDKAPRISIYQYAGDVFGDIKTRYEYGHPHVSDMLSSVFNFVLFQKLGLLNDIDSYRIYSVFLASALAGLVFYWTASLYGKFSGLIASLSLSLYPLFLAESHFNNEKDVPETVFWSFMLFSVWRGITTKSWKWIIASGIFFGLAVGTKFNILFSVFVVVPWLAVYLVSKRQKPFSTSVFFKKNTKLIVALITAPILGVSIFVGTWPLFWSDPIHKVSRIVAFYKTIGTGLSIDQRFIGPFGINTYAIQWILYTTPLVILFLAIVGTVTIVSDRHKELKVESMIFLLWLIVPVVRVTWPGTNIYGGVRQIMEYIPAMAIIAGIGGGALRGWLFPKHKLLAAFLILAFFVPIAFKLIQIHPYENVYFNPLIGGLKGAKERNFPGWGVSFGAPYREAIEWVNKNAEPGAKLTLGFEILSNIPGIFIRPDIDYKSNRSGYLREGEYVISLRSHGTDNRSYFDMYLDKMVEPLHEITVDGVAILKIWKNDEKHLKPEWKTEKVLDKIKVTKNDSSILFELAKEVKLSRLELKYLENSTCKQLSWAYLVVSKNGKDWERVPGVLPEEARIRTLGIQPSEGKFIEPFVGQVAKFIEIRLNPEDSCLKNVTDSSLYYFE